MRKNLPVIVVSILVVIIILQAYFLYKKEEPKQVIDKTAKVIKTEQETKESIKPLEENITSPFSEPQSLDTKQLEQDIKKIFRDILGSKEVQDGIDDMKEQLQEAQKQMNDFLKEFDKIVQDDALLDDIFKTLGDAKPMRFEEVDEYYILKLPIKDAKESDIDIQIQKNILIITLFKNNSQDKTLIIIPNDALIEKMQTNYQNSILEIVVPKIVTKTDI